MDKDVRKTDEELLSESLKNPAYFGELFDRYERQFLRAAYNIVRNNEEAQDIVQEAFVNIYKGAKLFKKREGASFKSWAYRVLTNKAISHYRKLRKERERFVEVDPEIYENLGVEDLSVVALDNQLSVERVMGILPEHLARLVRMHYIEDKPYTAIAEKEDISLPTLKMRLFRAKKLMRDFINKGSDNNK